MDLRAEIVYSYSITHIKYHETILPGTYRHTLLTFIFIENTLV